MAATLRDAGFTSWKADPDVWMRPNVKPDGFEYYEYVLVYVDDVLCMSHNPKAMIMDCLKKTYTLKAGSVGEPTEYLGCGVKKYHTPGHEQPRWAMSSVLYVQRAIADVESELAHIAQSLK